MKKNKCSSGTFGDDLARRFNLTHPGHEIIFDGVQDNVPGCEPYLQFTATDGPAKKHTIAVHESDLGTMVAAMVSRLKQCSKNTGDYWSWYKDDLKMLCAGSQ